MRRLFRLIFVHLCYSAPVVGREESKDARERKVGGPSDCAIWFWFYTVKQCYLHVQKLQIPESANFFEGSFMIICRRASERRGQDIECRSFDRAPSIED
jgi:hypothetical protein